MSGEGRSRVRRGAAGWTWVVLLALNLPIAIVVIASFSPTRFMTFPPPGFSLQWYETVLTSANWRRAIGNSMIVALGSVALATPLGVLGAFGLVRGNFLGRRAVMLLSAAPMIVPGIVVAVAMYFFYARLGLVGSTVALILAHAALVVPVILIGVSAVLVSFDRDLERAARSLGAGRIAAFRHVTWPLIQPAILSGMLFAFLMSFDELTVALFVSGVTTQTLPVRMWTAMRDELTPAIAAISTLLIVMSILVIAAAQLAQWLGARRLDRKD